MTYVWVYWHVPLTLFWMYVTWLIRISNISLWYLWHNSFICMMCMWACCHMPLSPQEEGRDGRSTHMSYMWMSHVTLPPARRMHGSRCTHMSHTYIWIIRVTWLSHMYDTRRTCVVVWCSSCSVLQQLHLLCAAVCCSNFICDILVELCGNFFW